MSRAGTAAGFWARLFAFLIDGLLVFLADLAITAILFGGEGSNDAESWVTILIAAAYFTIPVTRWATTPGKRIFGMYILRSDGSKLSPLRAFGRWLAYIPSFALLLVGFLMIAFRHDKRGLHDLLAGTVVVYRHGR